MAALVDDADAHLALVTLLAEAPEKGDAFRTPGAVGLTSIKGGVSKKPNDSCLHAVHRLLYYKTLHSFIDNSLCICFTWDFRSIT